MSLKNWLVRCDLSSPLCGDPPMLCALMEYELSLRLGQKHARKMTRDIPLSEIDRPPIPVAQRSFGELDLYCSSNPILGNVFADYTERQSKRFDTDTCALLLTQKSRKKLLTSSGPYKSLYLPLRVRVVDSIYWFVRGDRKEMNKLLKKIVAIGKNRNCGYGRISWWSYEQQEDDHSIFTVHQGKNVVMKTVPISVAQRERATGYRHSFGGAFSPYWHPETFMEIAIPC